MKKYVLAGGKTRKGTGQGSEYQEGEQSVEEKEWQNDELEKKRKHGIGGGLWQEGGGSEERRKTE